MVIHKKFKKVTPLRAITRAIWEDILTYILFNSHSTISAEEEPNRAMTTSIQIYEKMRGIILFQGSMCEGWKVSQLREKDSGKRFGAPCRGRYRCRRGGREEKKKKKLRSGIGTRCRWHW